MPRYAMLLYDEEYIPLTNEGGTLELAVEVALERIYDDDRDDGDLDFEIVELSKAHQYNTADYQDYFGKKYAEAQKHHKEQQAKRDQEEFDRLKKKLGK